MTLTHGQTQQARRMAVGKFRSLTPERQVKALHRHISLNRKEGALEIWRYDSDEELRAHITELGNSLGLDVDNTAFATALARVTARTVDRYAEVRGTFGIVPSDIVEEILLNHASVRRDTIVGACARMAAAQGGNGVKVLSGKAPTAELKLLGMGGKRVYATTKNGMAWVFDKIGNHT